MKEYAAVLGGEGVHKAKGRGGKASPYIIRHGATQQGQTVTYNSRFSIKTKNVADHLGERVHWGYYHFKPTSNLLSQGHNQIFRCISTNTIVQQ